MNKNGPFIFTAFLKIWCGEGGGAGQQPVQACDWPLGQRKGAEYLNECSISSFIHQLIMIFNGRRR
jgi:hypothetical protein